MFEASYVIRSGAQNLLGKYQTKGPPLVTIVLNNTLAMESFN